MLIENPSPYLKHFDIDGDKTIIEILDEGEKVESQYKTKDGTTKFVYQFKVKLLSGTVKIASIKGKSLQWMLEKYGKDSSKWVGVKVPVFALRNQLVAGKKQDYYSVGFNPLADDTFAQPDEEPETGDIDVSGIPAE